MAKHGLGEALKSVRYAGGIANWLEVSAAALRGDELTHLKLRNGLEIESAAGALLVPLYKEIVYKDDYRLRSDPLPRGAVVVDIGANLGMFSLHVAADHGAARVLAFEPFPDSFALLKRNAERNRLDAIQPIPLAIAGQAGTRELHMQGRHGVHSLFGTSGEAVRIECITLADAFARFEIARCDFLKLDCEGAEYEILLGAEPAALARVAHIALEYHDGVTAGSGAELAAFLTSRGFAVRTVPNRAHPARLGLLYATSTHAA